MGECPCCRENDLLSVNFPMTTTIKDGYTHFKVSLAPAVVRGDRARRPLHGIDKNVPNHFPPGSGSLQLYPG
jgi:hypothetical protein